MQKAAQLALVLHKRPSKVLGLKGFETWLLEVDYQLVMEALESTNEEGSIEEKKQKMKEWWEKQKCRHP